MFTVRSSIYDPISVAEWVCGREDTDDRFHVQEGAVRLKRTHHDMQKTVRLRIEHRLDQMEDEQAVTVLYACESGSRAWGFPSTDSDYDVRFVYVHPRDWYLSVDREQRDDTIDPVIEDVLDLHGWDLRKALGLFQSANPTLLEWLRSPIRYREIEPVMARWRDLLPEYYTRRTAGLAYRGMARSVAEENLAEEPVPHKAYLYVLRALLAVRWVEQDRGLVPVEFDHLVEETVDDPTLRDAITTLVTQKKRGTEREEGPRVPVLHDFIEMEIERQASLQFPTGNSRPDVAPLNRFFRDVLARDYS